MFDLKKKLWIHSYSYRYIDHSESPACSTCTVFCFQWPLQNSQWRCLPLLRQGQSAWPAGGHWWRHLPRLSTRSQVSVQPLWWWPPTLQALKPALHFQLRYWCQVMSCVLGYVLSGINRDVCDVLSGLIISSRRRRRGHVHRKRVDHVTAFSFRATMTGSSEKPSRSAPTRRSSSDR